MNTTQNWIPLTGPGGRSPTENDSDYLGCVHVATSLRRSYERFDQISGEWTHFFPCPKAPPLPKPVEKTQDEKDMECGQKICGHAYGFAGIYVLPAIRYGRADGRKSLAKEALGLFEGPCDAKQSCEGSILWRLHTLLTKAAGEKV